MELFMRKGGSMLPAETSRRLFLKMVAALGLGFVIPGWMARRVEAAFRVGDVPSKITLNDLNGNRVVIPSDFRGKVALIHFWASWCPTCRGEMTALEALYAKYGGKGVLPCSIGLGEKKETTMSYLKNMTISYPVLLDPGSSSRKPFTVAGVPTYYVLDRECAIRYRILGEANKEGLDKIIRTLL
jgi:cytochrome c biogenesis protein CcmG, thiol:disulfide interchange protein DsbE